MKRTNERDWLATAFWTAVLAILLAGSAFGQPAPLEYEIHVSTANTPSYPVDPRPYGWSILCMRSNTEVEIDRGSGDYSRPVFIVMTTPGLRRWGRYSERLNTCVDAYSNTAHSAIYNKVGPEVEPYYVSRRASDWDFSLGSIGEDGPLGRFSGLRAAPNEPLNGRAVKVSRVVYHWPYDAPAGKADYIYRDRVPQSEYSGRIHWDLHVSYPQRQLNQATGEHAWFVQIACIRSNPSEPMIRESGADQRVKVEVEWWGPDAVGASEPKTVGACYQTGDFDVVALPVEDERRPFLRVLPSAPTEYLSTCNEAAQSMGRKCQRSYIGQVHYHYPPERGQPQANTAGRRSR